MARVVMIGIDGLDADLLRVYGPSLPHVRRLMLESPLLELKSSFPPETAPAWASLYTGLNPGEHGILGGEISRTLAPDRDGIATEMSQGEAFWDSASQAGKRVCVINPVLAYPSWPLHGVMLTMPSVGAQEGGLSITPRDAALDAPPFPGMSASLLRSIGRHPGTLCEGLRTLTLQQAEYGLQLFQQESWDIFYQQFDALDYVEHLLWRYSDPGDASYPGRNKHSGRILDFYRLFDTIIGHFRSLLEADDVLLIVSAHGHGKRSRQSLNLNEWLRSQQLLTASTRSTRLFQRHYVGDWAKHHAKALLEQQHGMKAFPHIPAAGEKRKTHYTAHLIDQDKTMAQVVALAGGSSFGGIALSRECIERNGKSYEEVRADIVQRLRYLRLKGRPAVYWVDVRETIYQQGSASERFPDILFELHNEYGVNTAVYVPLVTTLPTHRWISGEHRMSGVCLLGKLPATFRLRESVRELTVMDVAPIVLQLIGVNDTTAETMIVSTAEAALVNAE